MNRATSMLAALSLLMIGVDQARASSIAGPSSFSVVGGSDTLWGIEFTANQNAALTGFDFHHQPDTFNQPFTGTISLVDVTNSSTAYSTSYGPNAPTVISFTGLNVALTSGHVYDLVATSSIVSGANDEVYQYLSPYSSDPSYPVSNGDITVTKGIFDNSSFSEGVAWAAFTNISTTSGAVPEPASLTLVGSGLVGLTALAKRRRNRAIA